MKALLFEDPFWLYGILAMMEAVLAWLWWRGRERAQALRLLVPLGLGVLVFAVSTLVVTDREKIQRATKELVSHVQERRVAEVEAYLDEEFRATFQGRGLDRKEALAKLAHLLSQGRVGAVEIKQNEVEVNGPEATQRLSTVIELRGGFGQGRLPVHFLLRWVKTGKTWRIFEIAEPSIGITP